MRTKFAKEHLQHELLNLMTILQLKLHEEKCPRGKKGEYFHLLKLVQTLIRFESILLGKKNNTGKYISYIPLRDIIQSSIFSIENAIESQKARIKNLKEDVSWNTDRNVFADGLACILYKVLDHSSRLEFHYDERRKSLVLNFISGKLPKFAPLPLTEIIDRENIRNNHLMLQLGIKLLTDIGIISRFTETSVTFHQIKKRQ